MEWIIWIKTESTCTTRFCKHRNEPSVCIKDGESRTYLTDYLFLNMRTSP
jgi:hypothetical protein